MKKLIKITAVAFMALGLASCTKWLDVSPKTEVKGGVLFSNQAGFRDALIGVYSLMNTPSSYGSDLTMSTVDVLAQTYDNVRSVVGHSYENIAKYNYTDLNVENRFAGIWRQQYKAIVNANLILSFIDDKREVFKPGLYNIVKGESLALRGLLHFDLLRLFSPSMALGANRKAIPYANAYTNVPFPQSTVNEVLDKVIKDLQDSRELLRSVDPYGPNRASINLVEADDMLKNRSYRMNYYAVTGLLARVYLYKGDKENALLCAKEVLSSDLFPMFTGSAPTKGDYIFPTEQLFSLKVIGLKTKYADTFFPELTVVTSASQLTMANTSVDQIFPPGVNTDYRTNWLETAPPTSKRVSKYSYNDIIPMIKKSEMYLIAAECEPTTSTAVSSYLNTLRAHRSLEPLDPATTTAQTLTTEIGNEYRKEFIAEGQLFYYYKRTNKAKLPNVTQFANTELVYIIPIPSTEIEFGDIH